VANTAQAKKRARQAEVRRTANKMLRTRVRSAIKDTLTAIEGGDKTKAEATLKSALPIIDSSVNKGIIHKNKAARHKGQLNRRIHSMA
jgi:small subunit ribosomal protein S20